MSKDKKNYIQDNIEEQGCENSNSFYILDSSHITSLTPVPSDDRLNSPKFKPSPSREVQNDLVMVGGANMTTEERDVGRFAVKQYGLTITSTFVSLYDNKGKRVKLDDWMESEITKRQRCLTKLRKKGESNFLTDYEKEKVAVLSVEEYWPRIEIVKILGRKNLLPEVLPSCFKVLDNFDNLTIPDRGASSEKDYYGYSCFGMLMTSKKILINFLSDENHSMQNIFVDKFSFKNFLDEIYDEKLLKNTLLCSAQLKENSYEPYVSELLKFKSNIDSKIKIGEKTAPLDSDFTFTKGSRLFSDSTFTNGPRILSDAAFPTLNEPRSSAFANESITEEAIIALIKQFRKKNPKQGSGVEYLEPEPKKKVKPNEDMSFSVIPPQILETVENQTKKSDNGCHICETKLHGKCFVCSTYRRKEDFPASFYCSNCENYK